MEILLGGASEHCNNLETTIAPITIPTISIDQTIPTNFERSSSSEISTSNAAKGVELKLIAMPYSANIIPNKTTHP